MGRKRKKNIRMFDDGEKPMTKNMIEIEKIINAAVVAGINAGRIQESKAVGELYKATERRLYAYPILLGKIENDKEHIQELLQIGVPEKSKSITRFNKTGLRLTPDEKLDALITDMNATIAADEYEVKLIESALHTIADDNYYMSIYGRFFEGMNDDDIAGAIQCDASTVRRNRGRLIRALSVRLYGSKAL